MIEESQEQLLKKLNQARDALLGALEGLDERAATAAPILGDWTVKDVLAHLVAWGDEIRSEIREILADPTPRYGYVIFSEHDYDQWNQSQVAAKRSTSFPDMRAELERDYREMAALLERLTPEELRRRGVVPWKIEELPAPEEVTPRNSMGVAELIAVHIGHLAEHTAEIRRWRVR